MAYLEYRSFYTYASFARNIKKTPAGKRRKKPCRGSKLK